MTIKIDDLWVRPSEDGELRPLHLSGDKIIDAISLHIRKDCFVNFFSLAKNLGIERNELAHIVHYLTGMNPNKWVLEIKYRDACWLLLHTLLPLPQISRRLGYSTDASFHNFFRNYSGTSPFNFRKCHQKVERKTIVNIIVDERY